MEDEIFGEWLPSFENVTELALETTTLSFISCKVNKKVENKQWFRMKRLQNQC
jgi:hypothetical protein